MRILSIAALFVFALPRLTGQEAVKVDRDRDGLSDALEDSLLTQFAPRFLISTNDCSVRPAEFVPLASKPIAQADNGTIYGQAFPLTDRPGQVELHFYHLWRIDCGEMGHDLDAEHVSALVAPDGAGKWKALYWYAAAHEDTVCDASQITRAGTIGAEDRGPQVWISRGKHASFLSNELCNSGCGGDRCRGLQPLPTPAIINLGEPSMAVNGATWASDPHWPLALKMQRTDFSDVRLIRLNQLPGTAIAWANPQKRSYQAAIRGGDSTVEGIGTGARATGAALSTTDVALDLANTKTSNALAGATKSTGNGMARTFRGVVNALRTSAQKVDSTLAGNPGSAEKK